LFNRGLGYQLPAPASVSSVLLKFFQLSKYYFEDIKQLGVSISTEPLEKKYWFLVLLINRVVIVGCQ
jgi:hypothetical protein